VEDTLVFSLSMIHIVITMSGHALAQSDDNLAKMIQVDLLHAMCQAVVRDA
jgi:hypothetical protein